MTTATLTDWVQGALRPTPTITWYREDGALQDLTGAVITAVMTSRQTRQTRAAAGAFALVDAAAAQFSWTLDAADVAESGAFDVQFTATYPSGPTPARTFEAKWAIRPARSAP